MRIFGLGTPVGVPAEAARGAMGRIFRVETSTGAWAVKELFEHGRAASQQQLEEQASFVDAAAGAGVGAPRIVRSAGGAIVALRRRRPVAGIRVDRRRGSVVAAAGRRGAGSPARRRLADRERRGAAVQRPHRRRLVGRAPGPRAGAALGAGAARASGVEVFSAVIAAHYNFLAQMIDAAVAGDRWARGAVESILAHPIRVASLRKILDAVP
jgi:hypothetical protein